MRPYHLVQRVSYADVDFLGELKVSALLGVLEQAATEASIDVGFDAATYQRHGVVWIVRRTRVRRLAPVGGGDPLEVETAVCDFRRVRSLRRYTVRSRGVEIAEATTDWVYCSQATGHLVRVPEALQQAFFPNGVARPVLPRAQSIAADPPHDAVALALTVQPSHLDHVAHVNNAVYADFLEDGAYALFAAQGWPLPRMLAAGGALSLDALDAEYRSDAQFGDKLCVESWMAPGSAFDRHAAHPAAAAIVQRISRVDGSEVVRAASEWRWRDQSPILGAPPQTGAR